MYVIQHSSHEHPLVLRSSDDASPDCAICSRYCHASVYACEKCDWFNIHKACVDELLPEINHPFHPQHPLSLLVGVPYNLLPLICNACGKSSCGFTYHCSQCQFVLHMDCATLMPRRTIESSNNTQTSHPHTLFLCNTNKDTLNFHCCGCRLPIEEDSVYVCFECRSMLCQSCAELPQELKHPFHPDHTLVLLPLAPKVKGWACCSACGEPIPNKFVFHCFECEFNLHIRCSFLMPINIVNNDVNNSQQYVRHPHPLFLCESKKKFDFSCACKEPFKDDSLSIFCCVSCNKLLHKSCAELPFEIKSIIHPDHHLSLKLAYNPVNCQACLQIEKGSAYVCNACGFYFCVRCTISTLHTINSELHEHPLVFITEIGLGTSNFWKLRQRCNICNFYATSNMLRCVTCDIDFHLHCIPNLPHKANDGIHRHALTLTKSPIKDHEDEDEDSEFLCDHCEKERRLCDPTYYCAECHYVAHVHCLISEIVRLMEEEWSESKNVEVTKQYSHTETTVLDESHNPSIQTSPKDSLTERMEPEELDKFKELRAKVMVQKAKVQGLRERLKAFENRRAQIVD